MTTRNLFLIVTVLCLSFVSTSARALVGPGASYFEIDGDYGSAIGDFNTDNGGHPYSAHEIRDGGNETWGTRDTSGCTNWSHYTTAPYMGASAYTVSCANVPAGETRRSEQMLLSQWRADADSARYFTYAFRLRGLPSSVPDGNQGFLAQWHQGASDPPPFRMQWAAVGGRYQLQSGVWYDTKDSQGRRDRRHYSAFVEPQIHINTWYRILVMVNLGTPPGIAACPYCPSDSGAISVWLMNNATGAWTELGTYNGRVGYWYEGAEGTLNPPYRSARGCEFQWKIGQYVNT